MSNDLSLTLEIQLTHDLNVFIRRIHDSPVRLVLAITGGGSRAISELLEVPGGSRTLLEAVVPYSAAALDAWLGGRPWRYCDQATARAMAMAAFQRGRRLSEGTDVAGVGATASLMSDAPKRGPHRVHVAMQAAGACAAWSLELIKDRRTRPEEELLASRLILNAVAEAAGLVDRLSLDLLEGEQVQAVRIAAPPGWRRLLLAEQSTAGPLDRPDAAMAAAGGQRAIFPGAFNPLHDGHKGMARVAQEMLGMAVEHEISIFNVDKPPLDFLEMAERGGQFKADEGVWFTNAATFVEKSKIFPGATFIVGADTIERLAQPRYHGDDTRARDAAIDQIAANGCRFLVFGRRSAERFQTLDDLALSPVLREISRQVPAEQFRADISSTALRGE